jgi:hypothetical protein
MSSSREISTPIAVGAAINTVLAIDPDILGDSARFRRAIADLLPDDERSEILLALSNELGIPQMIRDGYVTESLARLRDLGGIEERAAVSIVNWWSSSLKPDSVPFEASAPTGLRGDELEDSEPSESPRGAYQVRLAGFSATELFVAISTSDGYFATLVESTNPGATWRRLASPDSPLSRDLFVLLIEDDYVMTLWSDTKGVECSYVRRTLKERNTERSQISISRPSTLVPTSTTAQIRFPIAALSTDTGLLDVFWSSDQQQLSRSSWRDGVAIASSVPLPNACEGEERLTLLDVLSMTSRRSILAVLTNRFRILTSEWDLELDIQEPWRSISLPMSDVVSISLSSNEGRTLLFTSTRKGRLFAVEVGRGSGKDSPWWQITLPTSLEKLDIQSMSVTSYNERLFLALSGKSGLSIASTTLRGSRLEVDDVQRILK